MCKYYIVSFLAILINLTVAKADNVTRDSIGVENYKGKKLIMHQVAAKDTYYSIARRYNVVPKDIMSFNDSKLLQIGVIIKVPTALPFAGGDIKPTTADASNTIASAEITVTVTEHVVQRKENLNMLAEKYGTTVNEIKKLNGLNSINLQIGQVLKIPSETAVENNETTAMKPEPVTERAVLTEDKAEKEKIAREKAAAEKALADKKAAENRAPAGEDFLEHVVASNETMYSIATRYKMTMDQLKAKNNLTDNSLSVGQHLLIKGQYPAKPTYVPPLSTGIATDSASSLKDPSLRYPPSKYGLNQMDEKGTAVWIADTDLDPSKMLVLHRTAPIGTVMKITNPMSNRSTFAKVVGKFTENESTKDVIIVMTKAVADALGAIDKRFYCNLTYGGQENEQ